MDGSKNLKNYLKSIFKISDENSLCCFYKIVTLSYKIRVLFNRPALFLI